MDSSNFFSLIVRLENIVFFSSSSVEEKIPRFYESKTSRYQNFMNPILQISKIPNSRSMFDSLPVISWNVAIKGSDIYACFHTVFAQTTAIEGLSEQQKEIKVLKIRS